MIQLFINEVAIPLPVGVTLQREYENRLFSNKEEAADFTIPVDLPLTDQLSAALNYPQFLGMATAEENFPGRLIVNGIWVSNIIVKLLKCSPAKGTVSVSLIGSYGTLAADFGDKKVSDLVMGGKVNVAAIASTFTQVEALNGVTLFYKRSTMAEHMQTVVNGTVDAAYTFPQALDMNGNISGESEGDFDQNCINAYDVSNKKFAEATLMTLLQYGIREDYIIGPAAKGKMWFWVPQFYLHLVLKACFTETGYTLSGSILEDAKFKRVLLHNTFAINTAKVEKSSSGQNNATYSVTSTATSITPANHLPNRRILDFVIEVAKAHNLQIEIDTLGKGVQLVQIDEILDAPALEISDKADVTYEINYEKAAFQRGLQLTWNFSDGDSLVEAVKEISSTDIYRGQVAHLSNIGSYSSAGDGDLVFVGAENCYYQKEGVNWNFWGMNYAPFKTSTGAELEEVVCNATPVQLMRATMWYISKDPGSNIAHPWLRCQNSYALPVTKKGIAGRELLVADTPNPSPDTGGFWDPNFKVVSIPVGDTQNAIRLSNWLGMLQVNEAASSASWASGNPIIPCASPTAHGPGGSWDSDNIRALVWRVPGLEGDMVQYFWARWARTLLSGKSIDVDVVLDAIFYSQAKLGRLKVGLWGLEWLVQKAQVLMPFPNLARFTLARV